MANLYSISLILIFSFSAFVLILLFFVSAPYGKFSRRGWGPTIQSKWAWMIMEFPSPALIIFFFFRYFTINIVTIIFLLLWLAHYLYRTFIYSFWQSGRNKPYPLVIVLMALVFNSLNGTVNGYGVFHLHTYASAWLTSWQFIIGVLIFILGYIINKTADKKLRSLRNGNPGEYVIPKGWMFKYISCPHYFGEIIEWGGWAVMTWSLPGLAFSVFTFANLFPRAIASHQWYKANFPDYPSSRKALIPFII
jgi:3-oxo-5-alpha-steroid 4-dehydrogenase 1